MNICEQIQLERNPESRREIAGVGGIDAYMEMLLWNRIEEYCGDAFYAVFAQQLAESEYPVINGKDDTALFHAARYLYFDEFNKNGLQNVRVTVENFEKKQKEYMERTIQRAQEVFKALRKPQ